MKSKKKIVATIEARMNSSRLPGKVLKEVVGKPMLELMIERLHCVPSLDGIVIATTESVADDPVVALVNKLAISYYRGSEENVLQRVLDAARFHAIDVIVELTGDCPLIDPEIVEETIQLYLQSGKDYISNTLTRSYPLGMDTQIFSTNILSDVARRTNAPYDCEHVSLYIYRHPEIYSLGNLTAPDIFSRP